MKKEATLKNNLQRSQVPGALNRAGSPPAASRNLLPPASKSGLRKDNPVNLKEAVSDVHRLMLSTRRELEIARKMRNDVHKYQQETATRARSDAQQLILRTRLATQRQTEEMLRQSSEEIQKVLADIRMIRIMAQEELAAQRKFTDAARIRSMSMAIQDECEEPEPKKKKPLVSVT